MEIQNKIYVIRGMRVMMDVDLAELYGIETKVLNQAVKRNLERFPEDFMFRLEKQEVVAIWSQSVTISSKNYLHYIPYASVLHSPQAIQVNIAIMRLFTQLRSYLLLENKLDQRITNLEEGTNKMFRIVFERLDALDEAPVDTKKKKIGLKN